MSEPGGVTDRREGAPPDERAASEGSREPGDATERSEGASPNARAASKGSREPGGATVYVHEADAPLVGADDDAWAALHDRQCAAFEDWGMPAEKRDELLVFLDGQGDLRGGRSR